MIKMIKIIKKYRNGSKEHFLTLLNEYEYSNIDIDCLVEEWCENDGSGMIYGYTYTWSFVEDIESIKKILIDEIKSTENGIESLIKKKIKC
jgi:hypothetical protein